MVAAALAGAAAIASSGAQAVDAESLFVSAEVARAQHERRVHAVGTRRRIRPGPGRHARRRLAGGVDGGGTGDVSQCRRRLVEPRHHPPDTDRVPPIDRHCRREPAQRRAHRGATVRWRPRRDRRRRAGRRQRQRPEHRCARRRAPCRIPRRTRNRCTAPSAATQTPAWTENAGSRLSLNGVLFDFDRPVRAFGAWLGDLDAAGDGRQRRCRHAAWIKLIGAAGQLLYEAPIPTSTDAVPTDAQCGGPDRDNDRLGCGNQSTRLDRFRRRPVKPWPTCS